MSSEAVLVEELAACGLKSDGIDIRYEPVLQSEVITLGAKSGVSEQHFACLWEVARGSFVEIADQKIASDYKAFADEKARSWLLAEATAWLKAQGKYDGAPVYTAGRDLVEWAEAVETFCGMRAGEALEVLGPKMLTFKPIDVDVIDDPRRACLFHVLNLSDLEKGGIESGFIGHEYYPEDGQ